MSLTSYVGTASNLDIFWVLLPIVCPASFWLRPNSSALPDPVNGHTLAILWPHMGPWSPTIFMVVSLYKQLHKWVCSQERTGREKREKGKKKTTWHTNCWWGYGAAGTLIHLLIEMPKNVAALKKFWQFLRKLSIHLPYDHQPPRFYWMKMETGLH